MTQFDAERLSLITSVVYSQYLVAILGGTVPEVPETATVSVKSPVAGAPEVCVAPEARGIRKFQKDSR